MAEELGPMKRVSIIALYKQRVWNELRRQWSGSGWNIMQKVLAEQKMIEWRELVPRVFRCASRPI